MTAFVDQFSDHGYQLLNACLQDFPTIDGFIKNAELDPVENERRPEHAFAWPERRMFPIDSPDQAALSRLYMTKQASLPAGVLASCDKALAIYGVEFPFQQEKVASVEDDSCYLLPHIKRFSVKTAEDLQLAAEALERNQNKLSVNDQATAAMNLVKQAVLHQARVPSLMLKLAGMTVCETQVLRDWLDARAYTTKDSQIGHGFTKMAELLGTTDPVLTDREDLIKIAATIQELDEAAELTPLYGKRLPNPLEVVFNTEKMAAEVIELAGRPVPLETILSTDPQVYSDVFGPEIMEDIGDGAGGIDPEKVMVVLPTMPRDLLNVFLAQLGV